MERLLTIIGGTGKRLLEMVVNEMALVRGDTISGGGMKCKDFASGDSFVIYSCSHISTTSFWAMSKNIFLSPLMFSLPLPLDFLYMSLEISWEALRSMSAWSGMDF